MNHEPSNKDDLGELSNKIFYFWIKNNSLEIGNRSLSFNPVDFILVIIRNEIDVSDDVGYQKGQSCGVHHDASELPPSAHNQPSVFI